MRKVSWFVFGWLLFLPACGRPAEAVPLVSISGIVTFKGKPLEGAEVLFTPVEDTRGHGGTGRTGPDGIYILRSPRGQEGAPVGRYKVTISHRLMPDGAPVPQDDPTPPIESSARETLPTKFSSPDRTGLMATVLGTGENLDFHLK